MYNTLFVFVLAALSINSQAQNLKLNGPKKFIEIINKQADSLGLIKHDKHKAIQTWNIMLGAAAKSDRRIPLWDSFNPKKTALVVVDMQNAFVQESTAPIEIARGRDVVDKINHLSSLIRKLAAFYCR